MLVDETARRFGQERCPDQPFGRREFNQQSINEAGLVISLMNSQTPYRFTAADQNRRNLADVTIDERIPKMSLNLS